ncbi:hypothetical protein Nepgr_021412 [Nepenthes gracilis]|uniref:Uncharacterized protein n=1 Tax=Nepenthes gracilis TaxID=150966 RepID=A0AAD3SZ05_NEPGR|nr:hypothetical protein Nepgr_021412 [Nepenthes gracilis]
MSCSVADESSVAGVPGDSCEVALDVNCEPLFEIDVHSSVGNADLGLTQIPLPSPDIDSPPGISHGLRVVEAVALDGYVAEDRAHPPTAEPSRSSRAALHLSMSYRLLDFLTAAYAFGVLDESVVVVSIPNLSVEIDPKITPILSKDCRKYGLESNSAGRASPRLFDHLDENHPIMSSGGFVDVVPNPPFVNRLHPLRRLWF